MTPNFPVWGLMLAAFCVAAPVLDMLIRTLLDCDIPMKADKLSIAHQDWRRKFAPHVNFLRKNLRKKLEKCDLN